MNPFIEFKSVTKRFRDPSRERSLWKHLWSASPNGKKTVIENFDLRLNRGDKVVIVGKNGIGKTTLLKLAGGFILPTAGRVELDRRAAHRTPRSQFGLMLSTHLLYTNLTGYQNLEYSAYLFGCPDVGRAVAEVIDQWGLAPVVDDFVESYSNGRRALLAIARALIHRPSVLLLDEPTAYLDDANVEKLISYLSHCAQTVLITTQDQNTFAALNPRVVTL